MTAGIDAVLSALRLVVADVLPNPGLAATLGVEQRLSDAGLDSLRTVELLSALEERFGIVFDEADLRDDSFTSLAALVALLGAKGVR